MAASTSSTILDAVRSGDLDTLEQASDEQLLEESQSRKHLLIKEAVKSKQWAAMWWLLDKAEQFGHIALARAGRGMTGRWTRAQCAAASGNLDMLRGFTREELLQSAKYSETCVHAAALGGQAEAIEFLVRERGLDHSATTDLKRMPVHVAAEAGHVEAVEKLVELGADVDAVDFFVDTAMSLAVLAGHAEVVKVLLRLGRIAPLCDGYDSAIHKAAKSGSVETVDVLLGYDTFHVEAVGRFGMRPLHHAALCGDVVMVKHLLDLGANMHTPDDQGWRPLHYAACECWRKAESGVAEVVRVLLLAGADRAMEDHQGKTARDVAVESGYESAVELLDSYWPFTLSMTHVLLGLGGPTESPLTRFSSHALFEPRVLALVKCLLTGEDKGAFSQLMEEAERS